MATVQEYRHKKCVVLGLALGDVPLDMFDEVHQYMAKQLPAQEVAYLGTFPVLPELSSVTLDEVYHTLSGKLLFTELEQLQMGTLVPEFYVATSYAGEMLNYLVKSNRPLLITTPDRIDTLTTALAAHSSGVAPLSGVVITSHSGVASPARNALRALFEGLEQSNTRQKQGSNQFRLPMFMTPHTTYETLKMINRIEPAVLSTSSAKIDASFACFEEYADPSPLMKGFEGLAEKLTPSKFLHHIRMGARDKLQRIVLPESGDSRILMAAMTAQQKGYAQVILLGTRNQILQDAAKIGAVMEGITIIDPATDPRLSTYIDELVEARKKKGLSRDQAADLLADENYFATMMVRCGDADGLVSGAIHTTAATVRPGMQVLKDSSMPLVSSVFFMCLPDKVLVYGDCAINVDPTPQQLAYIAIASADTAAAFGMEPRVAMLSYSTLGSGSGAQVEKVTEAVKIAQEMRPELPLTGPIQYDAATNERVAAVKVKGPSNGVAGKANVLIFPDLNTGNNTYKAVQQATGALALGPLLQGLDGAVNDLSRGCTVGDVVDTICATCLQAQFKKALKQSQPKE